MINIAVMFGGRSVEHDVSVATALIVMDGMNPDKYRPIPIYISREGAWYTGERPLRNIESYRDIPRMLSRCEKVLPSVHASEGLLFKHAPGILGRSILERIDVVFPSFLGAHGEDGCMQGLYEIMNLPYVGCPVSSSALGMDKILLKSVFRDQGIPVVDHVHFHASEWAKHRASMIERIEQRFPYPLMAKPYNLGSSVGVFLVSNRKELEDAVDTIVHWSRYVIAERYITPLKEINCAVLGDHDGVRVSLCEEPIRSADILTYADKYLADPNKVPGSAGKESSNPRHKIPADVSPEIIRQVQEYASRAFLALDASGNIRFDFLMNTETQEVYLNEPNTMPAFLAAHIWHASHLPLGELLDQLIALGLKKYREKDQLVFNYYSNLLHDFGGKGGCKAIRWGKR